jgi:hypothetical protein
MKMQGAQTGRAQPSVVSRRRALALLNINDLPAGFRPAEEGVSKLTAGIFYPR